MSLLLAAALALAPFPAGAAHEPGHRVRVIVDGGRISVAAEAAPILDIVRAITERTGVEITAVNAGRLEATVTIEREPIERAIERVVRAVSPAANAASVFTYNNDDQLRAVRIIFRAAPGSAVAEEGDAASPSEPADASGPVEGLTYEQRRALIEKLRQAGVPSMYADLLVVEQLAEAGVSLPEILEQLRVIAAGEDGAPALGDVSETAVTEPLSEVDRQAVTAELTDAGAGQQFEDGHLLAARQLKSDGVPLPEILEVLRATGLEPSPPAGAGQAVRDDPTMLVILPSVSGEAARRLTEELRQAGVPEGQLDEGSLVAAQQMKASGVAIEEIRENLAAIKSTPREEETSDVTGRPR